MNLTSPSFNHNEEIPQKYTCKGLNINPPFKISQVPKNVKSLILIIEDKDATPKPWVHWLVYNIPPDTKDFPEGKIPKGAHEGICNNNTLGYEGPCPIYFEGTHHYHFRLIALDKKLDVKSADREKILSEAKDHIIEEVEMIGLQKGTKERD